MATALPGIGPQGPQGEPGPQGPQGNSGPQGSAGPQGVQGQGFKITKIYASVAELEADTAPVGIVSGEFAVINSLSEPDNGKLYLWNGVAYDFMVDLSGTQGVQGPQGPQGPQGAQGVQGPQGPTGPAYSETFNRIFIDFMGLSDHALFIGVVSGGTNTAQPTTGVNATENCYGVMRMTVTAANQYAGGRIGNNAGMVPFHMGSGASTNVSLSGRWTYTTSLPDVTDTTKTHFGFVDDVIAGGASEPQHFIGFRYDPTVNSGKFQAVVRTSGVDGEAVNVNHTPVANVNDVYLVAVDTTGMAKFYINGVLVHTSTTALPVPAQLLGPHIKVLKTAGTSAKLLTIDWMMLEYSRSTER